MERKHSSPVRPPDLAIQTAISMNKGATFLPVDESHYGSMQMDMSQLIASVTGAMEHEAEYRLQKIAANWGALSEDSAGVLSEDAKELQAIAHQLRQIENARRKIADGKMPSQRELQAITGNNRLYKDDAVECLNKAADWAWCAAQQNLESQRVPPEERSRESDHFYDLTDRHYPSLENEEKTIPVLLLSYGAKTALLESQLQSTLPSRSRA